MGRQVRETVEQLVAEIARDGDAAAIGEGGSRLCALEGFVGRGEQANVRVRRCGDRNVPYGAAAERD